MDHPEGVGETGDVLLDFDRRTRLEFHGSTISSDGGLLLFRERPVGLVERSRFTDLMGRKNTKIYQF